MKNIKNLLANLALTAVATVLMLGVGELMARLVLHPGDYLFATLIDDPILGHRIAAHSSGHDARGFRNDAALDRAWLVAVGDSQTYGVSASLHTAWPQQLAEQTGRPVYNMGLGGYGPLEYRYLVETVVPTLAPSTVVIGLYLGNDLADAHRSVYSRAHWKDLRQPDIAPVTLADELVRPAGPPGRRFGALRDWLARNSVLYGVLRVHVLQRLHFHEGQQLAAKVSENEQYVWVDPADPAIRTIFTPTLRLTTMDTGTATVNEGLRLTKQALLDIGRRLDEQHRAYLVVVIPTKERVYCDYIRQQGQRLPPTFETLCATEQRLIGEIGTHLRARGIRHLDATAALRQRVTDHIPIYNQNSDGHPIAGGYEAIAAAIHTALDPEARDPARPAAQQAVH